MRRGRDDRFGVCMHNFPLLVGYFGNHDQEAVDQQGESRKDGQEAKGVTRIVQDM